MRDKEAIENERKILVRNLEKQTKVVEKLRASEGSLRDQLVRRPTVLLGCSNSTTSRTRATSRFR